MTLKKAPVTGKYLTTLRLLTRIESRESLLQYQRLRHTQTTLVKVNMEPDEREGGDRS